MSDGLKFDLKATLKTLLGRDNLGGVTILDSKHSIGADIEDIAVLPEYAVPKYDKTNLSNTYGVFSDAPMGAWAIDLSRDDAKPGITEHASPYLKDVIDELRQAGASVLVFLPQEHYDAYEIAFEGDSFIFIDEESCIAEFMCPHCAQRDCFNIDVIGADPDDVDIMESQSRIQSRMAEGDLDCVSFQARFYKDGSEDTCSDTEWDENGVVNCPDCGHTAPLEKFRCLHDE